MGSMKPDVFAAVETALAEVRMITAGLFDGDSEDHVRRSIEDFASAFSRREAIGPVVGRLRDSIVLLHGSRDAGRRRDVEDKALLRDLDAAIEERLLPALQRLGFDLNL
jgi:hypothetical protein